MITSKRCLKSKKKIEKHHKNQTKFIDEFFVQNQTAAENKSIRKKSVISETEPTPRKKTTKNKKASKKKNWKIVKGRVYVVSNLTLF